MEKALLAVALVMLGACDGAGQGPVEAAAPPERDAARSLVSQIAAITEQPTEADKLLQAADFTALLTLAAPPGPPVAAPWGTVASDGARGGLRGCLLASGTAATLTECELGDHVIDGTWSVHHQRTHTQLVDVFVDGVGHRGSLWIDANLLVAPDAPQAEVTREVTPEVTIDGSLEVSLMWNRDGRDHALDALIRVEGLVVEGPGCATAGAVTIDNTSGHGTTTLWFGPTCRDVHISRHVSR